MTANGVRSWWQLGLLHREDGPAIERPDGSSEWWIRGKFVRAESVPA